MPTERYLENRILSADPIELIEILYEHAIKSVREARSALAAGDIAGRCRAISRTIGILGELQGSLDKEVRGTISQNLAALYHYMRGRLTAANLKQQDGPLGEVEALMQTLGEAWKAVRPVTIRESPGADLPQRQETTVTPFLPDLNTGIANHSWTA